MHDIKFNILIIFKYTIQGRSAHVPTKPEVPPPPATLPASEPETLLRPALHLLFTLTLTIPLLPSLRAPSRDNEPAR